ncbi:MAG: tetratricopeptide repeat protein [Magnetococcales bacterium]|nr:tetratricopeptide repeat protein [Magnetococcales bacterium]
MMPRPWSLGMVVLLGVLAGCAGGPDPGNGEGESFPISLKKGRAYLERGVPDMALPALRRARTLRPDDAEVLLLLGMAYDQSGRPVQSLEALEEARRLRPGDGRILNNLGVALMRLDRLDEAREVFREALADGQFPTPEEVHYNLALLHRRQGSLRAMEQALEQALRIKPGHVPTLMELAEQHRALGRLDLEQKRLRRVLEEVPTHLTALERLVASLEQEGKTRESVEWLRKIRALDSSGRAGRRAMEKLMILERDP